MPLGDVGVLFRDDCVFALAVDLPSGLVHLAEIAVQRADRLFAGVVFLALRIDHDAQKADYGQEDGRAENQSPVFLYKIHGR